MSSELCRPPRFSAALMFRYCCTPNTVYSVTAPLALCAAVHVTSCCDWLRSCAGSGISGCRSSCDTNVTHAPATTRAMVNNTANHSHAKNHSTRPQRPSWQPWHCAHHTKWRCRCVQPNTIVTVTASVVSSSGASSPQNRAGSYCVASAAYGATLSRSDCATPPMSPSCVSTADSVPMASLASVSSSLSMSSTTPSMFSCSAPARICTTPLTIAACTPAASIMSSTSSGTDGTALPDGTPGTVPTAASAARSAATIVMLASSATM